MPMFLCVQKVLNFLQQLEPIAKGIFEINVLTIFKLIHFIIVR